MANKKISQLQTVSELDGTEVLPIVQGGTTKKVTAQAIADLGGAGGGGSMAFNIIADGTVTSQAQNATLRQAFVILPTSGNQTVTALNYPEIYMGNGATATTITITNIPVVGLSIQSAQYLQSVSLPDLVTVVSGGMTSLSIAGCQALTTVSFPLLADLPSNSWYQFGSNAFTQATVDYVLQKFAATSATNCTLYLNSGSNASPSSTGLASRDILLGRGWTVYHN